MSMTFDDFSAEVNARFIDLSNPVATGQSHIEKFKQEKTIPGARAWHGRKKKFGEIAQGYIGGNFSSRIGIIKHRTPPKRLFLSKIASGNENPVN